MITLVLSGAENLSSNSGVWARLQRYDEHDLVPKLRVDPMLKVRVDPMLKDRRATKKKETQKTDCELR